MRNSDTIYVTNHIKNTIDGFNTLKDNEMYCDIKIACEDKIFSAHKIMLSIHSRYFCSLLQAVSCQCPLIVFRELSATQMMQILEFIYKGKVNLNPSEVEPFMNAALYLEIKGCTWTEHQIEPSIEKHQIFQEDSSTIKIHAKDMQEIKVSSAVEDEAQDILHTVDQTNAVYFEIKEQPLNAQEKTSTSRTYCTKQSLVKKDSLRHMHDILNQANKDSSKTSLSCPYCEKRFRSTSHRREHIRRHTGEKPLICSVCLLAFRHSKSLRRHQQIKHQTHVAKRKITKCRSKGEIQAIGEEIV